MHESIIKWEINIQIGPDTNVIVQINLLCKNIYCWLVRVSLVIEMSYCKISGRGGRAFETFMIRRPISMLSAWSKFSIQNEVMGSYSIKIKYGFGKY